jgi:hypothetical protein
MNNLDVSKSKYFKARKVLTLRYILSRVFQSKSIKNFLVALVLATMILLVIVAPKFPSPIWSFLLLAMMGLLWYLSNQQMRIAYSNEYSRNPILLKLPFPENRKSLHKMVFRDALIKEELYELSLILFFIDLEERELKNLEVTRGFWSDNLSVILLSLLGAMILQFSTGFEVQSFLILLSALCVRNLFKLPREVTIELCKDRINHLNEFKYELQSDPKGK